MREEGVHRSGRGLDGDQRDPLRGFVRRVTPVGPPCLAASSPPPWPGSGETPHGGRERLRRRHALAARGARSHLPPGCRRASFE
jgi:hypothetical protein